MNSETPRVFVAATRQNDGKTTTALGLFAAFKKRRGRIGYIKPIGQRFVEVEGKQIDEDAMLIEDSFKVHVPLEDMSPIAVEPDFTRKYIEHANNDHLVKRLQRSFDRAAWEKDFVIIEGTGHAGVGSVFDLSNARVAHLLQSQFFDQVQHAWRWTGDPELEKLLRPSLELIANTSGSASTRRAWASTKATPTPGRQMINGTMAEELRRKRLTRIVRN